MSNPSQETWKVYGRDASTREDCLIAEFPGEGAARAFLRRQQQKALSQDEARRETFWIVPPQKPAT